MRADRLLSILILLKTRGRMTARDLSRELEVSERTIYRDMDALSGARFPIYAEKGKEGGYALLPNDDLDLSDFNERDLSALAALNIPQPFFEIGLGSGLKTALEKLLSVLGEDYRKTKNWQQNRFIILPARLDQQNQEPAGLHIIQKAVWENQIISCQLLYPIHFGISDPIQLSPHTLIAAQNQWYLIAQRKDFYRIYPLSQLVNIKKTDQIFTRAADYDAYPLWEHWLSTQEKISPCFWVMLFIHNKMLDYFFARFGLPHKLIETTDAPGGWQKIQVKFDSLDHARMILLGMGGSVKVIEPLELRLTLIDYAKQTIGNYPNVV